LPLTNTLSKQPRIVVAVGLPGSGKSTYLDEKGMPSLSSDSMRHLLSEDVTNQSIHRQVFNALRYLLRERIKLGRPLTCVDATHLTPKERRPYLEIGRKYHCKVEAIFFDVPVEICQQRNRARGRVVPPGVIERMARKLVKPSRKEGFDRVTVVRP
jgi:predicted kinase